MAMWIRLYVETLDNPKVQRLSGDVFKAWVNLLCLAGKHDGRLPPVEDIGFALRMKPREAERFVADMVAKRLVDVSDDGMKPHDWDERQFQTDASTARVRACRARRAKRDETVSGNVSEPLHETAPEQNRAEAEQKQTSDANASAPTSGAARPPDPLKAQIFGPVLAYLRHSTGQSEAACRKLLGGWSRDYGDGAVIEAVTRAEHEGPNDPVPSIITTLKGRANGAKRGVAGSGRRPPGDDYRAEMLEGLGLAGDVAARQAGAAGGRSRDALRVVGEDIPF